MTEDEREIRKLVETWMDATKSGDLATVLDLMADDVLFMTPGREPFGKSEFQEDFEAMKGMEVNGKATIEECRVAGQWAWIRNHIDLEVTPAGGPSTYRSGHTLTVLRKYRDGSWRLFRDANLVN